MKKLVLLALLMTPLAGMAMTPLGIPVKKIAFASQIDGWQAVDKSRLILSTSPSRHFLITLDRESFQLPYANHVGVSTSNNTIYSGFDQIVIEGIPFNIKTIQKVTRAQVNALTKA